MFLYSEPKYIYQFLHNIIAKVILKTGRFIGYFWIDNQNASLTFNHGSNYLLARSIVLGVFLTSYQIYMFLYFHLLLQEAGIGVLSAILGGLTQVAYNGLLIISYITAITRRKYIIELLNSGFRLLHTVKQLNLHEGYDRHERFYIYNLGFKFFIDFIMISFAILIMVLQFIHEPTVLTFLFPISFPLSLIAYCLISTCYFVGFVYVTFLLRQLQNELTNPHSISQKINYIPYYYENILRYSKKVNHLLQVSIFFLLAEGLVGLVNQV